jgi:hypothetical protein
MITRMDMEQRGERSLRRAAALLPQDKGGISGIFDGQVEHRVRIAVGMQLIRTRRSMSHIQLGNF